MGTKDNNSTRETFSSRGAVKSTRPPKPTPKPKGNSNGGNQP